jgi:hypothetical protein
MKHLNLTPKEFCSATDACEEGREFAQKYNTMAEVWDACPRADWLLWILRAIDAAENEKTERLFAIWCARSTPMHDGRTTGALLTDSRSIAALEVAERFAHGNASREELTAARAAAWDAARAAAEDAARAAAGDAARAAADAADAAWAAADAADAAWAAAGAAAWAAARDAARAAAGAAAWAAQAVQLRTMVSNPFKGGAK